MNYLILVFFINALFAQNIFAGPAEPIEHTSSVQEIMVQVTKTYPGILSLEEQHKALNNSYRGTLFDILNFTPILNRTEIDTGNPGNSYKTKTTSGIAGILINFSSYFIAQGYKYSAGSLKEQLDYTKAEKANEIFNIIEKRKNYSGTIFLLYSVNIFLDQILTYVNSSQLTLEEKEDSINRLELLKGKNRVKANQLEQIINDLEESYYTLIDRDINDDFPNQWNKVSWEELVKKIMSDQYDSEKYWNNLTDKVSKYFSLPASVTNAYKIALEKGSAVKISDLEILSAKQNKLSKSVNKFIPIVAVNYSSTDTDMPGQTITNDTLMAELTWQIGAGSLYNYQASDHTLKSKQYAKQETLRKIKTSLKKIYSQIDTLQKQFAIAIKNFRRSLTKFREVVKNDNFIYSKLDSTLEYTSAFVDFTILTNKTALSIIEIKSNAHLIMGTYWEEIEKLESI